MDKHDWLAFVGADPNHDLYEIMSRNYFCYACAYVKIINKCNWLNGSYCVDCPMLGAWGCSRPTKNMACVNPESPYYVWDIKPVGRGWTILRRNNAAKIAAYAKKLLKTHYINADETPIVIGWRND